MQWWVRWLFVTSIGVVLAAAAVASPTRPVDIAPTVDDRGPRFVPGVRAVADLPQAYVEEEFLVSGAATLYNYAHDPPTGPTDIVPVEEDVSYQTRMIVRRPASADDFEGTVVIEWWNSTAGFDTAPVWDVSAEYFAREGIVYVGVTNSTTSIDFLVGGCRLFGVLPPSCGSRYAMLSLPENGLANEMMSQIAHRLKSDASGAPLPADFEVEWVYHAGQSQQGGSVITYASAFHFFGNDGYFIQQAATARPINFGPVCGRAGVPPFPACTPRLQGADALVRTDLPVPVVHATSETDIEVLFGTVGRQADTPSFRYYEVAGGSHLTVHEGVEVLPAGLLGPNALLLEDLCQFPINSTADGPVFLSYVFNALWENLDRQVRSGQRGRHGRRGGGAFRHRQRDGDSDSDSDSDRRGRWRWQPPAGVVMETGPAGEILRDAFGNGLGGVRLPALDVPTATYTPGNSADPTLPPFLQGIGNLACRLASSVQPFDAATIDGLYADHRQYVRSVKRSARKLRRRGFLLSEDQATIVSDAVVSNVACGLGFELVAVVPAILWLRRRASAHRRGGGSDTP